jgi:hypothetical protein
MPRFVLLQKLDDVSLAVAPPATIPPATGPPVTKEDVAVSFAGVDAEGHFSFSVPSYDPAKFHSLDAIHVGLYEKPAGGTAPVIPADPAEVEKAKLHYETAVTNVRGAETVVVDATEAPEGHYVALLVLEFAE